MSHDATNWAIKQRGMKPSTKHVLWHLCDRFHPDHGCFPAQETLADDCEMSRRSINNHLDELERRGLIKRVVRTDKKNRRRKSTLYLLAFQFPGAEIPETVDETVQKPCAKSAHGSMCKKPQKPCANPGQSHVQILHTNLVIEPLNNLSARKPVFFTDDERRKANQVLEAIRDGSLKNPAAVPDRLRQCLISENIINREEAEKHQLLPKGD
jgi:DNA-binding transcriptional MocR family regulator